MLKVIKGWSLVSSRAARMEDLAKDTSLEIKLKRDFLAHSLKVQIYNFQMYACLLIVKCICNFIDKVKLCCNVIISEGPIFPTIFEIL